jgi:putative ABC transport system ATP-binding protein
MQAQQLAAVRLIDVHRWYGSAGAALPVLRGATAEFPPGTLSVVTGAPRSGLSTLLNCAAGLDQPDLGTVLVGGTELAALSVTGRARLRRKRIGFIQSAPPLFPLLTAGQHVGLALRVAGLAPSRPRLLAALDQVGLADRAGQRVGELSPGSRQRLAVARALAVGPEVLLADEPTEALGTAAATVLALLRRLADQDGLTVIMTSRDPLAASGADQVFELAGGRLTATARRPGRVRPASLAAAS